MNRAETWLHLMSAALTHENAELHLAERAQRAAAIADYALQEYEKRCGGEGRAGFNPVFWLQPQASEAQ